MLIISIGTKEYIEIYKDNEVLRLIFFNDKNGLPKMGVIGPKSFDILRVKVTEENMVDLGLNPSLNRSSDHDFKTLQKQKNKQHLREILKKNKEIHD